MRGSIRTLALVLSMSGSVLFAGTSDAARLSFDGTWSVTATTISGSCDPSFRFPIQVEFGRVVSRDVAGVSGRVTARGIVQVSVRQGDRSVYGSGRLTRNTGAGRWVARAPSGGCTGQWYAQRG